MNKAPLEWELALRSMDLTCAAGILNLSGAHLTALLAKKRGRSG